MKIEFKPIGIVHNKENKIARQTIYAEESDIKIEIFKKYEAALTNIEKHRYIYLISFLHKSDYYNLKTVPYGRSEETGLFCTRSPHRINPIALSLVELVERQGNILKIKKTDLIDKTPILDIKSYFRKIDNPK